MSGFSADVARRVVGISYRQLDYWDKTGLLRPSIRQARGKGSRRVYSFEDLVELKVIARLLALGISLPAVRKATRYMHLHFTNLIRPLARLAVVADGKRILVRTAENRELVDVTSGGQAVISVAVEPIARELRSKVTDLQAPRKLRVRVGSRTFVAILTPDLAAGGYSIEVPEFPGVVTEADTVPEARRMTSDAIRVWQAAADGAPRRRSL